MEILKDRVFSALLALLRAGLWGREVDEMSLFPLDEQQWRELYRISHSQTVTGIVYRGISYLPEHLMPPTMHGLKWVAQVDAIERRSEQMNKALAALCKVFSEAGLHPVLQKGQGVAQMYAVPSLRESGDIDLWFPADEWTAAAEVAKRISGSFTMMPDGAGIYKWQGFDVEHHLEMFDIKNPFKRSFIKRLMSERQNERVRLAESGAEVAIPTIEQNALLLNTHILKHIVGLGVGLRQFCDLARFYHAAHNNWNGAEIKELYAKAGLLKWSNLLHSFLVEYLGLDPRELPYQHSVDINSSRLLDFISLGGNFGLYNQTRNEKQDGSLKLKINTLRNTMVHSLWAFRYAPVEVMTNTFHLVFRQLKG